MNSLTTLRQRKNVMDLTDAEIADLRDVFGRLKASQGTRNYAFFAAVHFHHCQHKTELFLPWHRAFLDEFDLALRELKPNVTLPYWDWMGEPQIPPAFDGDGSNPLYIERYTDQERRDQNLTLPTVPAMRKVMSEAAFKYFGGGFSEGLLEAQHDLVHTWVGPTMGEIEVAPCDPIFWAHHANVDRLWAQWQVMNPGSQPFELDAALDGLDPSWTVRKALNVNDLGYEYRQNVQQLVVRLDGLEQTNLFELRLPYTFSRVELRMDSLENINTRLNYIDVYLDGPNIHLGRISLFGLPVRDPSGDGFDLPSCFKPLSEMRHHHSFSPWLDLTDPLTPLRGSDIALRLDISGAIKTKLVMKTDGISLVFI